MPIGDLSSREAVLEAMAEFDELALDDTYGIAWSLNCLG